VARARACMRVCVRTCNFWPVRSTRTPCQQVKGADGLSRGRYVYVRRGRTTYTRIHTPHARSAVRESEQERDGKRTHTVDQLAREPCAAVPCRGISAAPPNGRHGTSPTPA